MGAVGGPAPDPLMEVKEVFWRPATATTVVKIGQPVCYNSDLAADYKERTTTPVDANAASNNTGTVYAEGAQTYNARIFVVEEPAAGNLHQFAGTVLELGSKSGADGDKLKIAVPNGAVVPVYTDANCTLDSTVLGVSSGSASYQIVTGDGDPLAVAVAMETVNRSGTNGLAWARVFGLENQFSKYLAPTRAVVSGYAYGLKVDGTNMLTGTAASKSYVVDISGERESAVATGDSNDAMLKVAGTNYAACDTSFAFRSLNLKLTNGSGGTLGRLDNIISIILKAGSTTAYGVALSVDAQDLAATAKTEFGGLDVAINREGLAATLEYGIQIRTRGTINSAMAQAIYVRKDATDHGFTRLLGVDALGTIGAYASTGNAPALATGDIMIPVKFGSSTYYIVAMADTGV
jgi:hypothetical protein